MLASFATALTCLLAFAGQLSSVSAQTRFPGTRQVVGYYPSYAQTPAAVPYSAYTHLVYFVFGTTPTAYNLSLVGIPESVPREFVQRAKAAGKTTSYSVGGYTASQHFSTHVSTAYKRGIFAKTLVNTMKNYGFDGIDLDWEYPGRQGQGDNVVSPNDAANLELLIREIRRLAPAARISMAVSVGGVIGADGNPLRNMTNFAQNVDYLTIMSYDIFGDYSGTTGPNSPLYDTCAPAASKFSVDRAVQLYKAAGFLQSHMLMGVPAYSYVYKVTDPLISKACGTTKTSLYQNKLTSTGCGNWVDNLPMLQYNEIVAKGYFKSTSGFQYIQDTSTHTSLLYSAATDTFIPTEDAYSCVEKGKYVRAKYLAGVAVFDTAGDDSNKTLLKNLRSGMSLSTAI